MLKELEAEIARLRAENADLRSELTLVRGRLDELSQLAALQNEQVSDLRAMLRRKTKPQKGTSPPNNKEGDTAAATSENLSVDGAAESSGEAPAPPPPANKPPRKPRSKGTGRRPLPRNVPEVTYEGKVCKCAHCGGKNLLARDREQRGRYDAAETIVRLRKELLDVVECKDCGETTTAEPPSLPCPRSKFTCGFLAWLVTMKFVLLVPLHRIWRLLRRQGFEVPKSTLVRLINLAAELSAPIDGAHWKELKTQPVIQTDATGIKVLIPGLTEAWHGILDVFNAGETVVYQFALTKHGDDLARLLKGFQGTILCDAESRLNELARQEGVKRANCNAHPRRDFRDAEASQPVLAKQAGAFLTRMYAIERRAAAEGVTGPELLARRQAETRPIVAAFKVWLEAHRGLLPSDPLGKVIEYYCTHFEGLTRFVDDANLPIDNNRSERAFQDHARLRLNSLFAGNPEGARNWALLLGIVTTTQRHDLDVQAYLTWMFERRGTRRREYGLSAADLTPAAYKKMLEEERSRAAEAAAAAA